MATQPDRRFRAYIVIVAIILVLVVTLKDYRRPYFIERAALELYCPSHSDDKICVIYNLTGLIYAPPPTESCSDPTQHIVGHDSDGKLQCCPAGYRWEGPDTEKCVRPWVLRPDGTKFYCDQPGAFSVSGCPDPDR